MTTGVVVIGRNEGDRLKQCLRSLEGAGSIVYVDSGSDDDSVAFARGLGIAVVELDVPPVFTAARARNAGLQRLLAAAPDTEFVQMVDGDCIVAPGWIDAGRRALDDDATLAVVFGRRRELHPDASVYNAMCDDEWNVPLGIATSCGGDALFRVAAIQAAGGYNPALIAGEEPDLCLRLRGAGWRVRRIASEMTLHDAAILRFGQWWRRAKRGGHAVAELSHRHGRSGDPLWRKQRRSVMIWAVLVPLCAVAGLTAYIAFGSIWGVALAAAASIAWPLQVVRIARRQRARGLQPRIAGATALLMMVGKFAELSGMILYHARRSTGTTATLIEYKSAERPAG